MTSHVYAIAYARVSTSKQAVEGESLDLQAELLERHIASNGFVLFPEEQALREPFTGTTDERPVYRAAIALIKRHPGKVKYFFVKTIDRFSRAGSLEYQRMKAELAGLGVELRDVGGVIQPKINSLERWGFKYEWSETSPSNISEVVLAEAAHHERSRILTRLIEAQIKLTQDGFHIGRANDGYLVRRIEVDGRKKLAQFPDPERASYLRQMFTMRAEGTHSDQEIVDLLNASGFRTRPWTRWNDSKTTPVARRQGSRLTVKHFQRLIKNPVYCGIIVRKWTKGLAVRAKGGEPLVSIDEFNRANRGSVFVDEAPDRSVSILYNYSPTRPVARRHKFSLRWPYKNVAACPDCGKPLYASASRGKSGQHFSAYHCARTHPRYAVPQRDLDAAFDNYFARVRFAARVRTAFKTLAAAAYENAKVTDEVQRADKATAIALLKDKKAALGEAYVLASPAMRAILERQVTAIDDELTALHDGNAEQLPEGTAVEEFLEYVGDVLEHPAEMLKSVANRREQAAVSALFFDRLPSYEEIMFGTPDLRPIFTLHRDLATGLPHSADTVTLDWNTLREEMKRWEKAYDVLDLMRTSRGLGVDVTDLAA